MEGEFLIGFDVYQTVSFALAASLFLFMTMAWIRWIFRKVRDHESLVKRM